MALAQDTVAVASETPAVEISTPVAHKKSKNLMRNRIANPDETGERGVVYLASIPNEMYEPQIREFFGQFGEITRMRLARSKRTGRPKHYGFVEFEMKEIAEIASKAMDNYFFQGTPLKCKFMPKEDVHPETFRNWHKKHTDIQHKRVRVERQRHNAREIKADGSVEISQNALQKSLKKAEKKRAKLAELGIKFDFDTFEKLELPERIAEPKPKKGEKRAREEDAEVSTKEAEVSEKTPEAVAEPVKETPKVSAKATKKALKKAKKA